MNPLRPALLAALVCAGCGGGPSAPSVPAAPVAVAVEVRDGWTGGPVAASVPPSVPGSMVSVIAPGFLPRVQAFNGPVYLWPQDETYVRQLVYGGFGGMLSRWVRGFNITAPGYEDIASQVAAEASRVTGLPITVGGTTLDVVVSVNEDDSFWADSKGIAYAQKTMMGHTIISARVVFRNRAAARYTILLHEVGHALGLAHTEGEDVMAPIASGARSFSDRETIALRMMYARRAAGNAPPDRESSAASASREPRTVVFVD